MAKAKQRYSWDRNATTGIAIKIDGLTGNRLEIDGREMPEDIQDEIFVYGVSKVIDDRTSQVDADGKIAAAREIVTQLMSGDWKRERVSGPRDLPAVIQAIMDFKGRPASEAQAAWRLLDEEEKANVRENLKTEILAIEASREEGSRMDLGELASKQD